MSEVRQIFTADIETVQIITKEHEAKTYTFKTANKIEKTPITSEGKEVPLEIKGVRYSTKKAKNAYVGTDIKMTDNSFTPAVFAVINGGKVTYESDETTFKSYEAPAIGEEEAKIKFDLVTYSPDLASNGDVLGYLKETYPYCEGALTGYTQEDDKFLAPEFTIMSRPPKGAKGYKIEYVESIPSLVMDELGVFKAKMEGAREAKEVKAKK